MIPLVAVVLVVVLLILAFAAPYNGLVRKRGAVDNAWAQIEVQLERRHDLVSNLVETVRGTPRTNGRHSMPSLRRAPGRWAPRTRRTGPMPRTASPAR